MFLSIWVHGTAGNVDVPCGEVDVFSVSGEKIYIDILNILVDETIPSYKMDWFGHLPTERALMVEAKDVSDEDGIQLEVIGYFEEPIPDMH